jgi:hypothetical protein
VAEPSSDIVADPCWDSVLIATHHDNFTDEQVVHLKKRIF